MSKRMNELTALTCQYSRSFCFGCQGYLGKCLKNKTVDRALNFRFNKVLKLPDRPFHNS